MGVGVDGCVCGVCTYMHAYIRICIHCVRTYVAITNAVSGHVHNMCPDSQ